MDEKNDENITEEASSTLQGYPHVDFEYNEEAGKLTAKLSIVPNEEDASLLSSIEEQINLYTDHLRVIPKNHQALLSAIGNMTELEVVVAERGAVHFTLKRLRNTNTIIANLQKENPPAGIPEMSVLKKYLKQEEIEDWLVFEENVEALKSFHEQRLEVSLVLAQAKNAVYEVQISEDNMTASLTALPPQGGIWPDLDSLKDALIDANVSHGRLPDEILISGIEKLKENPSHPITVAQATLPLKGEDTQFLPLFEEEEQGPKTREDGTVDHKNLMDFVMVQKGAAVLQRVPARDGTPGTNILGATIEPEAGDELSFSEECEGVSPSDSDPNILVADLDGHPVLIPNGAKVTKTIQFEHINVATGNIDFDGSLSIKGDVCEGMHVKATGDIQVGGQVDSAICEAGGSIFIKGGVHARAPDNIENLDHPDLKRTRQYFTILRAKNNIELKFISNSLIEADGNCSVTEYMYHCQTKVEGQLLLGVPAGKGLLVGGESYAKCGVIAAELGNSKEVPTKVSAGNLRELEKESFSLQQEAIVRHKELYDLSLILDKIRKEPTEYLGQVKIEKNKRLAKTFLSLKRALDELMENLSALEAAQKKAGAVTIQCKKQCHVNVTITLNGNTEKIHETKTKPMTLRAVGRVLSTE